MSESETNQFLHEQIGALSGKLDEVSRIVHATQIEVAGLKVAMAGRRECPSPGACIELKDELESVRDDVDVKIEQVVAPLRTKVDELKTRSDELAGGYKALMAVCIVGPIITAGLVWLIMATDAKERAAAPASQPPPAVAVAK